MSGTRAPLSGGTTTGGGANSARVVRSHAHHGESRRFAFNNTGPSGPTEKAERVMQINTPHALAAIAAATIVCTANAEVVLIDFGPSGGVTTSPDTNGNTWNNFTPGSNPELDNTSGVGTGIQINATSGVPSGSFGLATPNPTLLGDIAVPSATGDYIFSNVGDVNPVTFRLSGLDTALTYDLDFFGSRPTDALRTTRYTVDAANGTFTADLVTSGAGVGTATNGNDDTTTLIAGLQPNASGEIFFQVESLDSSFGYLNTLTINIVPAPGAAMLLSAAGIAAARRRR